MSWTSALHALHVLAAGAWLGGLAFTIAVVSPSFKKMEWTPAERIAVRSEVGRQYSKVARFNLGLLLIAAPADWLLAGRTNAALAELILIALILLLSESHARFYVPRLTRATSEGDTEERARILRFSIGVSMMNLALSAIVLTLCSSR